MGSLHEVNKSPWVTDGDRATFPPLQDDRRADVVVVGAGITGLTVARMLVEAGANVAVLDAGSVCAGATGYTTAKVTALHRLVYRELIDRHGDDRARAYAGANQDAVRIISDLVEADNIECDLVSAAAVTYTERDDLAAEIEAEIEACRRVGLPAEFTTTTELPYPVKAAVRLDDQRHFHPRRYCVGLARRIVSMGGAVHQDTRVLQVTTEPCGASVTTDRGTVTGDIAVLATHLPFLHRGGFFARAHPYRSYALSLRVRGDAPGAMYISAEDPTRSLRPAPGRRLIVGGEGHKTGQDPDTRERYATLEAWTRSCFDVEAIEQRWSAQDYVTVDGLPYVGRLGRNEARVLVATGFRKWGMTNGPPPPGSWPTRSSDGRTYGQAPSTPPASRPRRRWPPSSARTSAQPGTTSWTGSPQCVPQQPGRSERARAPSSSTTACRRRVTATRTAHCTPSRRPVRTFAVK